MRSCENVIVVMKGPGNRSSLACRHFEYMREIDLVKKIAVFMSQFFGVSVTVKMHHGSGEAEKVYLEKHFAKSSARCVVNRSNTNLQKFSKGFGLFVFTYDSAGFLEALNSNVPVIAVFENWPNRLFPSADRDYQSLVEVGILHYSVTSLTIWFQSNENNIPEWWFSPVVQKARWSFVKRYCAPPGAGSPDLVRILKDFA
jgi:putative transferase (TIGR04331 family)